MATINVYPKGDGVNSLFDVDSFKLKSHTDHSMLFKDSKGARVEITGHNLAFKNGELVKGTIDTVIMYDNVGEMALKARWVHLDATTFSHYYDRDGVYAFDYVYMLKADTVIGSKTGDFLAADSGNDVMYGRGGNDVLYSEFGVDTLYGEAGNDVFSFSGAAFDQAVIADFEDSGTHQDLIELTKSQYKKMHASQVGHDVVLEIGTHDITIEHYSLSKLGKDDFQLV